MFAEVILHRRVPGYLQSFTYSVPADAKVQPGQLVQVPFRKQKLAAIVRELHSKTPAYPTKTLEIPSEQIPSVILPKQQIELAAWMSKFYAAPFSKTIDFFVPEKIWPQISKRKSIKKPAQQTEPSSKRSDNSDLLNKKLVRQTEIQTETQDRRENQQETQQNKTKQSLKTLIKNLLASAAKKFILEKTPLPRRQFYKELLDVLPVNSQVLFLFPEIFHLQNSSAELPASRNLSVFHGGLKENQKAEIWRDIFNGKPGAIAGTRAALFLPFKNLSAIVLDFEHNENYKEQRSPYYNALEVAEKLAEIHAVPLIVISPAPRTETWQKVLVNKYEKIEWEQPGCQTKITVVDMQNEQRKGNYGLFSSAVVSRTAAALVENAQVLFFMNRKGEANAVICTDCSEIIRCKNCSAPFTLHCGQILKCHKCKIQMPLPDTCTRCGNFGLKSLGFGIEKIEKEIGKIFRQARMLKLDKDFLSLQKKLAPDLLQSKLEKADIIIATKIIDKFLHLPRLKLSVIVMPDALLNFPDFRASERLFQLLTSIRLLAHGEMIIQTFLPEHVLFNSLDKLENFYEDELKTRKNLNLAPFKINQAAT